ncbi:MAG: Transcription elongation factor GreA [Chlamydiales bacterium]|nr:Transcription elongation factor GreA [Chlamydiales bacterium]MCH9634862.1 Transcription elongation factor GreA [Chlamydiales bacterium]MCH9704154.1 GreA/GreB family elongation factor [Chlamydiota bacterium]
MSYLKEFEKLVEDEALSPFLKIWEEYCMADEVDGPELVAVLELVKGSLLARPFGQLIETVLPMWKKVEDEEVKNEVLRLILDLQIENKPLFADLALDYLKRKYSEQSNYSDKLRLVGLRSRRNFQGAITNFELLTHMDKGKFVFHTGGWGVGEVMDISLLQEHVLIEFEGIAAPKDLSFENAFKNLTKLPSDHFLARRFGDADKLEAEGKVDPCGLVRLMLSDLGPKTAQEIKEELEELVIPEADWTRWWQAARTKLKKDTMIQSPKTTREPFVLREQEVPHYVRLTEALRNPKNHDVALTTVYSFTRDFPEVLKNPETKQLIKERLMATLEGDPDAPLLSLARKLQASFLLEDLFPGEFPGAQSSLIESIENLGDVIQLVDTTAFKKRILVAVRKSRADWEELFLQLLFHVEQNSLRDYMFKELGSELLQDKIHELLHNMNLYPEAFFWYFQKLDGKAEIPFNDREGHLKFLEAFMIALHYLEMQGEQKRDVVKKMHAFLVSKRYEAVRRMIEGADIDYLRELLLLASKCYSFTKHDQRILHNLAEVVQPSLSKKKKKSPQDDEDIIWTTSDGYRRLQERIQEIGTVEMIDNAREIEEARAHGDLRENAEYKFALERRSRLQGELKLLSEQINRARILTKQDIIPTIVGPGTIVDLVDSSGKRLSYTLLGPWDADPENCILSFQSKFSQAMKGCKKGEEFQFQGEQYQIANTRSFLE